MDQNVAQSANNLSESSINALKALSIYGDILHLKG